MSGHSKWSSIKHRKAAVDARRGKLFTRLIREISVAARMGGADPQGNSRLRLCLQQARQSNLPMDTVQRAIQKGVGARNGQGYEEILYEGYGPGQVALLVEVLSDNRNRTAATLRFVFQRAGGTLAAVNSVRHLFTLKGVVYVDASELDEDTLTAHALEAEAEDLEFYTDGAALLCGAGELEALRSRLEERGLIVESAQTEWMPLLRKTMNDPKQAEQALRLLNTLETEEDVQRVFTDLERSDEAETA